MPKIQTPQTLIGLAKILAKHGRRTALLFNHGSAPPPASRVPVDVSGIRGFTDVTAGSRKVTIGTGARLGEILKEVEGENGLIKQAISMTANPLVRNRVTLMEALNPESPYFDIATALVALDARVKVQSTTRSRMLPIAAFLTAAAAGLKSGEFPSSIEFAALDAGSRVGFFRVQSAAGNATVSAAVSVKLRRHVAIDPIIVISTSEIIPVRSLASMKALAGRAINDPTVKAAAGRAAQEMLEIAGKEDDDAYERSLIEVAVSRALRRMNESPRAV